MQLSHMILQHCFRWKNLYKVLSIIHTDSRLWVSHIIVYICLIFKCVESYLLRGWEWNYIPSVCFLLLLVNHNSCFLKTNFKSVVIHTPALVLHVYSLKKLYAFKHVGHVHYAYASWMLIVHSVGLHRCCWCMWTLKMCKLYVTSIWWQKMQSF